MKEQLDLVKILKDCPKETKFYSPVFGEIEFIRIEKFNEKSPIVIKWFINNSGYIEYLTKDGKFRGLGECIIFPSKDQRDWNKWQRPFIDGDIIVDTLGGIHIMQNSTTSYCYFDRLGILDKTKSTYVQVKRFATEKEKQKLFDAIKANGFKWNAETKTLEKLIVPKFKVGDIIQDKNNYKVRIIEVNIEDELYGYESLIAHGIGGFSFNEQDNWKLAVKYKFKVGDKIRHKDNENILKIDEIDISGSIYCCGSEYVWVVDQDNYELVSNKFDYKTLKPFDKVLVRTHPDNNWFATFFSHINYPATFYYKFATTSGISYKYMIPYNEETKHLLGTNNEAPEYYRCLEN